MSGESENVKSVSSEVKQTENDDSKNENTQPILDEKDATEATNSKEVNSKPNQNSVDLEKNNEEKIDTKSDDENNATNDKDEKKLEDKKDIKSSPPSEVEKDNEIPPKDENKSTSKSESPIEKSTARDKKKVNQVADDSNLADSKEVKTDIPVGSGTQLGDIPRIDASISRFKNDDLKLLHRLLYKTPGKTTLIKKNIKKFNGFDFTKNTEEYDKKIASAKKFELKQLKSICEMLDLEKKGAKDEIIERVIEFLLEPKDSGKAVGGGRPKRTAAVRANNRGYSSHDDSYSSDEKRISRGGRGKGRRSNLKDDTTSESDEEFHPSDASDTKSRGSKRKKGGSRKKQHSDEEEDEVSAVEESMTSEDSDEEPRKRKKNKKIVNVNIKGRGRPKGSGRKVPVETEKKPTPTKKASNKRSKGSSESEGEDANTSSSEDEPLIKKAKSSQPPTDDDIRKYVKEILDGANLEEITMKTVCKQVYAHYPDFDLVCKKEFIKQTVKSLIST